MVQILPFAQLAQLALTNPDQAAKIAAASGVAVPQDVPSFLEQAPELVDVPILPTEKPQPQPAAAPVPQIPTPSAPGEAGAVLQQLFGPASPFSGVSASALQTPQNPVRQLGAPAVRGGSPGASQLSMILQALGAPQAPQPLSLGQLIAGG